LLFFDALLESRNLCLDVGIDLSDDLVFLLFDLISEALNRLLEHLETFVLITPVRACHDKVVEGLHAARFFEIDLNLELI
jgi:hypothetical protein